MRFVFGAAEAGFAPGIVLYLTYWFTADERARWVGAFIAGTPLALVIGGPISGFILNTLKERLSHISAFLVSASCTSALAVAITG
jgi:MFS family permease